MEIFQGQFINTSKRCSCAIGSKLRNCIQELDSYFWFPSDQQPVAMVCDLAILTLALPWLGAAGYKDDVDNAKELQVRSR